MYPRNKVVAGFFTDTIRNNFITDMINFKLSEGIVIIE